DITLAHGSSTVCPSRMPSVPGSNPPNIKYQQSDMNAIARLVKWSYHEGDLKSGAPYPPCTGMHRQAMCVYGAGDLKWIVQQHHLLANKFDPETRVYLHIMSEKTSNLCGNKQLESLTEFF
uniref:Glucosaminyl (N-acetyl) transferase 3, mucin type n=1 Tax=Sinocyclocheilus anshuiensis TaxID=1608454 RepID=A0A671T426_9TELE